MRTDDIVRQRFAKVFRGYDVQEVDLFLDDVIREMDRLEQERNSLLIRLEALLQELDRCDHLLHEYQAREKELTEAEKVEPAEIVVQPEELTELREEAPAQEQAVPESEAETQEAAEPAEEVAEEVIKEAAGEQKAMEEEAAEEEAVEEAMEQEAQPPGGELPHEA